MTQAVQTVSWRLIVGIDGREEAVALVPVNFGTDTRWSIAPFGSIPGQSASSSVTAKHVLIDNMLNPDIITLAWDVFSFIIPGYTRQNYMLTKGNPALSLVGIAGLVNVWFFQRMIVDDAINVYAASL